MVELYHSVENKMILTARRERITDKLIGILKKLNIEFPNFGLFLYPDRTNIFSSRWKAEKMIEISKKNDFTEINYYDDNIKQIKKISKFLRESNININIYKVTENSYKKYEN